MKYIKRGMGVLALTMVPLLRSAPLAQIEFVRTSRGRTVLVSRFQSAPHAECPLIWSGSSDARSRKTTRVGETTMDSSATTPDVVFLRSNRQPGALGTEGAARTSDESSGRSESADHFISKNEPDTRENGLGGND